MTARAGRARPRRPLWRDRRFSVFLASQTLSVAGDSFALIAVPLLILRATGSVTQMGLLTGAGGRRRRRGGGSSPACWLTALTAGS